VTTYLEMAQRLFPRLGKRDGDPEGELKAAEKRLGFALPGELRAMYRLAGRRHDLHGAHDRLVLPKKLIMVNTALVFYEENARVAAWAIRVSDIELPDPPVVTANNEPPYAWKPDHDAVSQFFLTELLWTHANTDPCCVLDSSPALVSRVRAQCEEIPLEGCHWNVLGCFGKGGVIVIVRGASEDHGEVHIGATADDELESFRASIT
jgi:hypothetical protein